MEVDYYVEAGGRPVSVGGDDEAGVRQVVRRVSMHQCGCGFAEQEGAGCCWGRVHGPVVGVSRVEPHFATRCAELAQLGEVTGAGR